MAAYCYDETDFFYYKLHLYYTNSLFNLTQYIIAGRYIYIIIFHTPLCIFNNTLTHL